MRKMTGLAVAAAAMTAVAGCTTMDDVPLDAVGEAQLSFADGRPAGTATLLNDARGLRIVVSAPGYAWAARLPPSIPRANASARLTSAAGI